MSGVFLKLLNLSINASWLILAVIPARLILKKAPKWISCVLWGLVALRLICPLSPESVFSLIPSSETIPSNIALQNEPYINSGVSAINRVVNPVISDFPATSENPFRVMIQIAAVVWIAGSVIMLAYALVSYLRLKKTVSACIPVKEGVFACDEVRAPFILGVLRPKIYVPSSMRGETLDFVLRHEAAHLRRRDHWWKPLGFILLSVYWFNPLCWIAYILLCRDIEMSCDEKVIRDMDKDDMAAYSRTILDCSLPRKGIAACPLAFGEVGVKGRVRSVLNYKKPAFRIILIAVVACIALAVCFLTNPFSNKSLSEKLRVSMDMAIAEHHRSPHPEDRFIATDYDVLLVSEEGNETTVYARVIYEEYSFDGKDVKAETGSLVPAAVSFDTPSDDNDSATYNVIEYWEPGDADDYADEIKAKFPWSIRGEALKTEKSKAKSEKCRRAAKEYFEMLNAEQYSLNDGRYVLSGAVEEADVPYILISEGEFHIIQDMAVSYQPSGKIERKDNSVIMKSVFADEAYVWAFELIGNDQLRLDLSGSKIPAHREKWKDGMVFNPAQESEAELNLDSLREKYPEYFDLSTFKGLEVYVWQMAPGSYSCGVMLGTNRNKTLEELLNLKGASIPEMRAILSAYDIDEEDIFIIPWQNPLSSYIPENLISQKDEDPAAAEKREQEYINRIREMLFGEAQNDSLDDTMVISSADLDIDKDGVYENCSIAYGPTYGLSTFVIAASADGKIKYKNTFIFDGGDISLAEKGGVAQLVLNGEYHELHIEGKRIVIDGLDLQYWDDSEWNYDLK